MKEMTLRQQRLFLEEEEEAAKKKRAEERAAAATAATAASGLDVDLLEAESGARTSTTIPSRRSAGVSCM